MVLARGMAWLSRANTKAFQSCRGLRAARWSSKSCSAVTEHEERQFSKARAESGFAGTSGAVMVLARGMASVGNHTSKWLSQTNIKTPMELIAEVPPIPVNARIVACEGTKDRALGHPVEFINLDLPHPQVCKYCGLRYIQVHDGHHGGHH